MTDWELLEQYRQRRSEAAFAELVDRHLKMVYWTCRRTVGDAETAEDCAQAVFVLLSQKAAALRRGTSVPGWLYKAARFVGKDALRKEAFRLRRDQAVATNMQTETDRAQEWQRIEPWIDEGLAALPASDREAVLLRFFYGLSLRDLGATLGTSEDAARKRVSRALDCLRRHLTRQGAPIAGATLIVLLTEHGARAVPEGCRSGAIAAVRQAGAHAGASAAVPHHGLLQKGAIMTMNGTTKKAAIAALLSLCTCAVVVPVAIHAARPATGAGTTRLTFSDKATLQASGVADPSRARSEIDGNYGVRLDKLSRRDPQGMAACASPDFTMTYLNGRTVPLASWARDAARFFSNFSACTVAVKVNSFRIDGNEATVDAAWHVEGTAGAKAGKYAGSKYVEDRVHEDKWQLRDGKWVNTSTRLTSTHATVNGQVVSASD